MQYQHRLSRGLANGRVMDAEFGGWRLDACSNHPSAVCSNDIGFDCGDRRMVSSPCWRDTSLDCFRQTGRCAA